MNFYWSNAIPFQKPSNEFRSYMFSWISTLTEVISIRNWVRNLRFFHRQNQWRPLITPWLNAAEPNWQWRKIIRDDDDRQINLRSNTHGCELKTFIHKEKFNYNIHLRNWNKFNQTAFVLEFPDIKWNSTLELYQENVDSIFPKLSW